MPFLRLHIIKLLFLSVIICMSSASTAHPWPESVRKLLNQPDDKLDLLRLKLAVDQVVDPAADSKATMKTIEAMVGKIEAMLPPGATSMQKLQAVRVYLYGKGQWNDFQPFQYDFDDPSGQNLGNKVLANYLVTKKGNCVSMPILMLLLADRLGLDVALSTAPMHLLMKFTESESGKTYNVEATSGGGFARDQWYQEKMFVTDDEIRNGIYLQKLTRKETAYFLADLLYEHYVHIKAYGKALELAKISLEQNPNSVNFMLRLGSCYAKMYAAEFYMYERVSDVPVKDRPRLYFLREQNQKYFCMAEARGWREKRSNVPASSSVSNHQNQPANRYGT